MHHLVPPFIIDQLESGETSGSFDCAGLFIDLSGFSAMTDALMAHGQHGAEILAQVIRATFDPLIRSVAEHNGLIATQEGDAFTALFPQQATPEACALHALAAAWQIQSFITGQPRRSTPYGDFEITAKIGLTFGRAAWGIVRSGNQRRAAYYFRGSAVDGSAAAEHHARAGDIILDSRFLVLVRPAVAFEYLGDCYRLLSIQGNLPAPVERQPAPVKVELASRFYPAELFTQESFGEFRQVAFLFAGLPTVREESQLDIFMQNVFELQDLYGGILQLFFGDKGAYLYIFWGAPVAFENDIDRALNFVLELQKRTTIPVMAGVTYRIAHTGFIGSEFKEDFSAFGMGANLAARFMTTAARGEVWVDEPIAQRAGARFELDDLGEKPFKGISTPQRVYLLLDRKVDTEAFFSGSLIGREEELEALRTFSLPLLEGKCAGMLVISGEPGMGKSRLVHEFLDRLDKEHSGVIQAFLAQTDEILRQPLNPFRYWLHRYFQVFDTQGENRNKRSFNRKLDGLIAATTDAHLADELDRTRSFLGALVGLDWPDSLYEQLDAKDRYENTLIALTCLLQAESLQQPVLLVLEDIHWLDVGSRAFLPRLLQAVRTNSHYAYPIMLLATAREEAGTALDGLDAQTIALRQMDRRALAELACQFLSAPANPSLLDLLEERTEGNPFFADQILRYLRETNLLTKEGEGWAARPRRNVSLPTDVGALLVARLDRLAQEVKEVVQTAAVLGREFEVDLLHQMLKDARELPEKVARAEQAAIWSAISQVRYLFKHALMRDAAYQMQLLARRKVLHAAALEAMETLYQDHLNEHYSALAYHADQAGISEKACLYLQKAGDTAAHNFENRQAVEYYTRALELTSQEDIESRFDLHLAREAVYEQMSSNEERKRDLEVLDQLVSHLKHDAKTLQVIFRRIQYAKDTGDFLSGKKQSEKAAEIAQAQGDHIRVVKAYGYNSYCLIRLGQFEEAKKNAEKGLQLVDQIAEHLGEARKEKSNIYNLLGLIAFDQSNMALAKSYFTQSLEIASDLENITIQAPGLNNLGMVTAYQGDLSEAVQYYEQSLKLAKKIGNRDRQATIYMNIGWAMGSLGDYQQAARYTRMSTQTSRELGIIHILTYGLINLTSYSIALGDYDAAKLAALESCELARRNGDRSAEAWAVTGLGHCFFQLGNYPDAANAYQQALEIRRQLDQPILATEPAAGLAQIALSQGDLPSAQKHIDTILPHLDGGTLEGTDEPLRVYLTAFLVLRQAGNPWAVEVLETAYKLLCQRSDRISDDGTRRMFLEQVPHHREIKAAWEQLHKGR